MFLPAFGRLAEKSGAKLDSPGEKCYYAISYVSLKYC